MQHKTEYRVIRDRDILVCPKVTAATGMSLIESIKAVSTRQICQKMTRGKGREKRVGDGGIELEYINIGMYFVGRGSILYEINK